MIKLTRKIIFYIFVLYVLTLIFLNYLGYWDNPSIKNQISEDLLQNRVQVIGEIITPANFIIKRKKTKINFTIRTKSISDQDFSNIKILVDANPNSNYSPKMGDLIRISSQIKKINPKNKYTQRFKYQNIYYKIDDNALNGYEYVGKGSFLFSFFEKVQARMLKNILDLNTGISRELMPALLLGNRSYLKKDTNDFIRGAGLSHIIAISGMHVGALYGFLFLLFRKQTTLPFACFALLFLWFYAGLTGFSPSCIRASTMLSLITIGNLHLRKAFTINNLVISAMLMLIVSPRQLFLVGFQLSFLGVFSIFYFYKFWRNVFNKLLNFIKKREIEVFKKENLFQKIMTIFREIFLVSLSVQIFLAPFSIFYFKTMNLTSILFNLVIVPFLSVIMVLGLISTILNFKFLAILNNYLIGWLFGAVRFLYERYSYFISVENMSPVVLVGIVCILLFIPIFKNIFKNKVYVGLFAGWVILAMLLIIL